MLVAYIMIGILIILAIVYITIFVIHYQQDKKNPIRLMINRDKRFGEIDIKYSHKIFDIKRGKDDAGKV